MHGDVDDVDLAQEVVETVSGSVTVQNPEAGYQWRMKKPRPKSRHFV